MPAIISKKKKGLGVHCGKFMCSRNRHFYADILNGKGKSMNFNKSSYRNL